jgi:PAS domain S-box-containing protein
MGKKMPDPSNSDRLRRQAEKLFDEQPAAEYEKLTAEDAGHLIHELGVHQIELEMQNDELRRSQEELEASRSKYADLYDFAPAGYFTFDKNGLIREANLTGAGLFGIERSRLIKKPFSSFIEKDCQDLFYLHRKKVLDTGKRQTCEIKIKRNNRTGLYVQMESTAVKDREGKFSRLRTVITDISGRRKAEDELQKTKDELEIKVKERTTGLESAVRRLEEEIIKRRQAEGQLREQRNFVNNIFESLSHPLYVIDVNTYRIVHMNSAALHDNMPENITCYALNHGLNKPCDEKGLTCVIRKIRETKKPATLEHIHYDSAGNARVFEVHGYPHFDGEGDLTQVIEYNLDITARKEIEDELLRHRGRLMELVDERTKELQTSNVRLEKEICERRQAEAESMRASHLASLGELAAGVAHEINNPINGIINYTQILANKSNPASIEHDITSRIIREGDRIANIVNSLLTFACRSNEGKHPVHIREIMSDALGLTATQIKKDSIKLKVHVPSNLPGIFAQPQHLVQVFLNLISNARYALNRKYPGAHKDKVLEIQCKKITNGKRPWIQLVFYDRGTGVPDEILNKIMNPFYSTKPPGHGTGLGLSISHGIIKDHGGALSIESVEGEFTRVIIELPAGSQTPKK